MAENSESENQTAPNAGQVAGAPVPVAPVARPVIPEAAAALIQRENKEVLDSAASEDIDRLFELEDPEFAKSINVIDIDQRLDSWLIGSGAALDVSSVQIPISSIKRVQLEKSQSFAIVS